MLLELGIAFAAAAAEPIAVDHAQGKDIRRILDICREIPVKARIVPSLNEIVHGHVNVSRIRDVQMEDLLGREPVQLDDQNLHDFLTGKVVMVTGAGGSIGLSGTEALNLPLSLKSEIEQSEVLQSAVPIAQN